MSQNAVRGQFVLVRIEAANDADLMFAAEQMGVWTPPEPKVYDKRDGSGVFVYGRLYLKPKTATVPQPDRQTERQRQPIAPRTVVRTGARPAPTGTDYDRSEDDEYASQTGRGERRPPF